MGLSVIDVQVERVLAGKLCSMDEDARDIIQKQSRLYTGRLLSAAMEAGFDLKAIPVVMLGGSAAMISTTSHKSVQQLVAHFGGMFELCRKKKIDLILTKFISRFARNTLDCIKHVRILKSWGIPVIFEKENMVFAQDGGIEFGGLRWWSAQIGGLTWWDASLSTTLCKENKEEICLRF